MSLDKAIQHGKENENNTTVQRQLILPVVITATTTGVKATEPFKANGLNNKQKQKLKRLETNIKRSKL